MPMFSGASPESTACSTENRAVFASVGMAAAVMRDVPPQLLGNTKRIISCSRMHVHVGQLHPHLERAERNRGILRGQIRHVAQNVLRDDLAYDVRYRTHDRTRNGGRISA